LLPILGKKGRDQLGALFVNGNFTEHLPATHWRTRIEALPDGEPLALQPGGCRPVQSGQADQQKR
jgi:hypothetical protein